ncbi:hypothetical protein FQ192_27200 [Pseudomonas sp. ANT_J12]|nr:hypothetical protein FQ192_27200 [Pseudomonas sp. ANT_J12]
MPAKAAAYPASISLKDRFRGQASLLQKTWSDGCFSTGQKKPAEAGFSQDHYDSLSAACPCLWSIIRDPEHSLCFS